MQWTAICTVVEASHYNLAKYLNLIIHYNYIDAITMASIFLNINLNS
ncbi:hypothetical protein Q3H59_004191 [Pantoea sp. SORGH_AS 659]|nr:hypothetical protein [Pantoea sp. SORGH_AS_0659]